MGEERRMFSELAGDLDGLSVRLLQQVLGEIGSGASCFGLLEEWEVWFDYLLPRLIPRCGERFVSWLFEEVCTAFLVVDLGRENSVEARGNRENILNTLGQVLMSADRWCNGSVILGKVLHPSNKNPAGIWGWANVSGDLAASLALCLRLIQKQDIEEWVESIFAIDCPYWRAQLLTWHVGARALLDERITFPSQFDGWSPKISWSWSHSIRGSQGEQIVANSLFPSGNIAQFKSSFEQRLRQINLAEWQREILEVEALRNEAGALIGRFKFA